MGPVCNGTNSIEMIYGRWAGQTQAPSVSKEAARQNDHGVS